jgi:hypothetical protein
MPPACRTPEKSGSEPFYPNGATFAELLHWHLSRGTRPNGSVARPGKPWSVKEFAFAVGVTQRSVNNWYNGRGRPIDFRNIMKLPKAEQNLEEWQRAAVCLIGAADGRRGITRPRDVPLLLGPARCCCLDSEGASA